MGGMDEQDRRSEGEYGPLGCELRRVVLLVILFGAFVFLAFVVFVTYVIWELFFMHGADHFS
jgi:hypothetical protein